MTDLANIVVKVDTSQVKGASQDINKLGTDTTAATGKIGSGFDNAKTKILSYIGAYVGFNAAKAAISGIISAHSEFAKSISELSAITGATGKDLQFYTDQAKEIGRTTSLSASQAATAFKLIASAKPDLLASAESLAAVTREAVTLAEAAGIALPDAARALGSALNQFQLPASDASRVINALAASSKLGTAEVGAVTEALRNAGSAANSLGLDFEETVAGIQALAASGREGADAGTALRQVLLRLESTANEKLQPSVVGLVGALDHLKTMSLDNTELMDLFGQEAFTAATSLLSQSHIVSDLNVTLRGTNTATEQAAINMDNLSGDVLASKSAFEALQIEIGGSFNPALRAATQASTAFIASWADANKIKNSIEAVASAATMLALVIGTKMVVALAESTAATIKDSAAKYASMIADQQKTAATLALANADLFAARSAAARTPGFYLNAQAMAALTAAEVAATGASTAHTAAMGRSLTAMTALKGAMALIGGPVGVAMIAAFGVYKLTEALLEMDVAANRLSGPEFAAQRIDVMSINLEQATVNVGAAREAISLLLLELASANEIYGESSKEVAGLSNKLDLQQNWLNLNKVKLAELTQEYNSLTENVDDAAGSLSDFTIETQEATASQEEMNAKAFEVLGILSNERGALNLSSLELAIRNNLQKAGVDATSDLGKQIIAATTALNLEEQALIDVGEAAKQAEKDNETAQGKIAKAAEEAARIAEEKWARTHEFMTTSLLEIAENGGNAFNDMAKAFETMVKRMVAEWLASGLMGILSGQGLGGFNKTTGIGQLFSGGGLTENIKSALGIGGSGASSPGGSAVDAAMNKGISTAASKIGSLLGIGGGTIAAGTAVGGTAGVSTVFAASAPSAAGITSSAIGGTAATGAGGIGATLSGIGSSITGGLATAGSTAMSLLSAIPGWGWALGGAALLAKVLAKEETLSNNGGFLIRDIPSVSSDRKFDVPAFDSGFDPVGFARREDQGAASEIINVFRADDAMLTALAKANGLSVNYDSMNFGGYNEKGQGNGLFFGTASEDGKNTAVSLEDQRSLFISHWLRGLSGQVDQSIINAALSQGSADAMLQKAATIGGYDGSHASGLRRVPFDGYRAELHKNEEVLTAGDPRNSNNGGDSMIVEMRKIAASVKRTADILMRVTRDGDALLTEPV